jgi:hypothetical protein
MEGYGNASKIEAEYVCAGIQITPFALQRKERNSFICVIEGRLGNGIQKLIL